MFRHVNLYLDIMTSYTLSPFLLARVQTGVRLWILFSCPLACCLLLFFFLILFLSFLETNLGSAEAEKALSKTKVDSSQPVHMKLWTTGYCFFDRDIISMAIHLSFFTCPINHIKVKTY